jgi:phosphoribosylaminoimidazole carboxylase (NCAIR synthetase)
MEISVLVVHIINGRTNVYKPTENIHHNHILYLSLSK